MRPDSAKTHGQLVNLETCNCLTRLGDALDVSRVYGQHLGHEPCDTQMSNMSDAQMFWVDSDARVRHGSKFLRSDFFSEGSRTGNYRAVIATADEKYLGERLEVDATAETAAHFRIVQPKRKYDDVRWALREAPEKNGFGHAVNRYLIDDLFKSPQDITGFSAETYQFVFVCEGCANKALPCQSRTALV